nr:MAG TPA: hypothetical protein [Caudoviricetes sp.]DAT41261.1 MAG TPA: hypothetical protein [Caudoviricetes sp.]
MIEVISRHCLFLPNLLYFFYKVLPYLSTKRKETTYD